MTSALGPISKAYEAGAAIVAACPTFQTAVGAANASEALASVHWPNVKRVKDDESDVSEILKERPWCLITMDQTCEWRFDFATKRATGQLIFSFEFPIPDGTDKDSDEALKVFANVVGQILLEMAGLASTTDSGGNWYWNFVDAEQVQPPASCTYEENPADEDLFYAASYRIRWI
jgi:hypothetical protein